MNADEVIEILAELRTLPFFPNDEFVLIAILRLCMSMCESEAQVRWLVDRMTSGIYEVWPGPREMRACFCCRFKPKDGLSVHSTVYPDGLPADPTAPPRIAAPVFKSLPPGREFNADPELEESMKRLMEKRRAPPAHPAIGEFARMVRMLREIETPPHQREIEEPRPGNPNFKPITQADIDRAVQELHERKARDLKP